MANSDSTRKRPAEGVSKERPSKRQRYDYENTITVLVGAGEKRFIVHNDAICVKSKFFRDACSKRWPEGQEKIVRLPEARSLRAFEVYMDWTYTNELVIDGLELGAANYRNVTILIEVYILGSVLDDVKLRNKTLHLFNEVSRESHRIIHPIQCHLVWDHTASNSSLRKYVVDVLVTIASSELFKKNSAEYPADLVLQVAITLMERRKLKTHIDVEALEERLETYMEVEDDV